MKKQTIIKHWTLAVVLCAATIFCAHAAEEAHLLNANDQGILLEGHDPVALFHEKEIKKGDPVYQAEYQGALLHFANQKHLGMFKSDPEKYLPQYGGFCAVSMSMGMIEPTRIDTWSIVNDKLYLQRNEKAVKMWQGKGPEMFIAKADENWGKVKGTHATHLTHKQVVKRAELNLAAAKAIAEAAHAYAKANKAPGGAIAVVDTGGHLLYLERLDNTFPAASMVAYEKARSAAMFRFPSKKLEDAIINGRTSLITVGHNMLRGGLPIYYNGEVVGGIGVSGAASADQDVEIATAGTQATF